jgi:hypothetical protein
MARAVAMEVAVMVECSIVISMNAHSAVPLPADSAGRGWPKAQRGRSSKSVTAALALHPPFGHFLPAYGEKENMKGNAVVRH